MARRPLQQHQHVNRLAGKERQHCPPTPSPSQLSSRKVMLRKTAFHASGFRELGREHHQNDQTIRDSKRILNVMPGLLNWPRSQSPMPEACPPRQLHIISHLQYLLDTIAWLQSKCLDWGFVFITCVNICFFASRIISSPQPSHASRPAPKVSASASGSTSPGVGEIWCNKRSPSWWLNQPTTILFSQIGSIPQWSG